MAKLTSLEEFKSQKEELLTKLENLQQHIDFLELDHKNKLNEIEKKGIIDKDRYRNRWLIFFYRRNHSDFILFLIHKTNCLTPKDEF